MKTASALALAFVLATGAALAQGSGGGTSAGPGGTNTGKDSAGMTPTTEQCKKGWDSTMRMTQAEFNAACKKQ